MPDGDYVSSEELQRHNADVFASRAAKKAADENKTEKDKIRAVLDRYVAKHKTIGNVREHLKEKGKPVNGRSLELQFEVSDGIVEILEKIKNELR
jgi:hypothetical protein